MFRVYSTTVQQSQSLCYQYCACCAWGPCLYLSPFVVSVAASPILLYRIITPSPLVEGLELPTPNLFRFLVCCRWASVRMSRGRSGSLVSPLTGDACRSSEGGVWARGLTGLVAGVKGSPNPMCQHHGCIRRVCQVCFDHKLRLRCPCK